MKTHLLDSCEPITEGLTQTAICGTEVKDAAFAISWDGGEFRKLNFIEMVGLCRKCQKIAPHGLQRYVYGITEAQNLREREAAV